MTAFIQLSVAILCTSLKHKNHCSDHPKHWQKTSHDGVEITEAKGDPRDRNSSVSGRALWSPQEFTRTPMTVSTLRKEGKSSKLLLEESTQESKLQAGTA